MKNKINLNEFYDESFFTKFITKDCNYYIKDEKGNDKLLFCLKKNALDAKKWTDMIDQVHDDKILRSANRNIDRCNYRIKKVLSGVVGYFDKIPRDWKRELPFFWGGRQTRYTREKKKDFQEIVKITKLVDDVYKETCPEFYKKHKKESKKIIPELKIGKTVFTTCSINKNLRVSAHRDKGDLNEVLSCLLCLGRNFKGCKLGFPEHKLAVNLEPGDLLLMNSHEIHCNTALKLNKENSVRYSLVFSTRKNMHKMKNKVRMNMVADDIYLSDEDFARYKKLFGKK